jgi:hypothetical protein
MCYAIDGSCMQVKEQKEEAEAFNSKRREVVCYIIEYGTSYFAVVLTDYVLNNACRTTFVSSTTCGSCSKLKKMSIVARRF